MWTKVRTVFVLNESINHTQRWQRGRQGAADESFDDDDDGGDEEGGMGGISST